MHFVMAMNTDKLPSEISVIVVLICIDGILHMDLAYRIYLQSTTFIDAFIMVVVSVLFLLGALAIISAIGLWKRKPLATKISVVLTAAIFILDIFIMYLTVALLAGAIFIFVVRRLRNERVLEYFG